MVMVMVMVMVMAMTVMLCLTWSCMSTSSGDITTIKPSIFNAVRLWELGFWVLGFGFWVLGFGIWVWGIGLSVVLKFHLQCRQLKRQGLAAAGGCNIP